MNEPHQSAALSDEHLCVCLTVAWSPCPSTKNQPGTGQMRLPAESLLNKYTSVEMEMKWTHMNSVA